MIELLRRFGGKFRRYMVIGPACKLIEVIFDIRNKKDFEILEALKQFGQTLLEIKQEKEEN